MRREATASMRSPRRWAQLSGIAAAAALVAGCGTASAATLSTRAVSAASAKTGGELKIGLDQDPLCVDPSQTGLISSLEVGGQIVNTLLIQDPKTNKVVPGLAKSWTASPDGRSYSFVLRKGVTFSNGQPLNAAAVKTYFDDVVAMGAEAPDPEGYLVGYSGTTVTGPYSFTVKFDKGNSQFPIALTMTSLGILAPATMAAPLSARCAGKDLYGTGPFVLKSYTPNVSVVLTKRAGYKWGAAMGPLAAPGHTSGAYLNGAEFLIEPDSSVRAGSLHSGQVDIATVIAPQDQPGLSDGGFHILSGIDGGVVDSMAANMKGSTILRDPVVRKAIQLAINRQQITASESPSYGVANSVLSPATVGYMSFSKNLDANPTEAKSLLEKDGWKVGAGGIRKKDGKSLTLTCITGESSTVSQVVQQQLRAVGIDVRLDVLPEAEESSVADRGDYDLRITSLSHQDPTSLWTVFGDKADGGRNEAWLLPSDPGVTRFESVGLDLYETTNSSTRVKLAREGQEILVDNNYVFPLNNIPQVDGVSDNVHGLTLSAAKYLDLYNVSL